MADIHALITWMKALETQLMTCMHCGICQSVCPLYAETGREADVARGKLVLLEALAQHMFQDPEGVAQRLNKCLLCGSCAANCPSGVNALEIFMKARAILADYTGLPPAKKAVLRQMLAKPERFDQIAKWGSRFQKLLTKPVNEVVGTSCARVASPLIGGRHFKPLAETPFHRRVAALDTPRGKSGLKVAVFVGCLVDKIFPQIAEATLKVLNHHGVGIYLPENQACCGIPAVSSGDTETFRHLLAHNLARFHAGGVDYLVTACATCTSTIAKVWPMMAGEDLAYAAGQLAKKTMDINRFLVEKIGVGSAPAASNSAVPITYHDPCHLKKSLGIAAQPRQVLSANPGYRLVEMPEADRCCGMGGSFNLQYYDISSRIGNRKAQNIQASGASTVATGCPACMLQLSDTLSRAQLDIAVRHPVEIYAEGIG
jgi:glycolate oxidase iron-sulfur subunit